MSYVIPILTYREHLLLKYAPQSVQISSNGYAESSKDDIVVTQPSNIRQDYIYMCINIIYTLILKTFYGSDMLNVSRQGLPTSFNPAVKLSCTMFTILVIYMYAYM